MIPYMTAPSRNWMFSLWQSWPICPLDTLCLKEIQQGNPSALVWCHGTDRSDTDFIVSNPAPQLVDELATSKRFKNIKLLNYVDEYDPDVQNSLRHDLSASWMRIWSFQRAMIPWSAGRKTSTWPIWTMFQLRSAQPATCNMSWRNFQKDVYE